MGDLQLIGKYVFFAGDESFEEAAAMEFVQGNGFLQGVFSVEDLALRGVVEIGSNHQPIFLALSRRVHPKKTMGLRLGWLDEGIEFRLGNDHGNGWLEREKERGTPRPK